MRRHLACCLVGATLLYAVGGGAVGAQPLDGGYKVIKQPPGECAATSTWLMLAHYYGADNGARWPHVCIDGKKQNGCSDGLRRSSELSHWIEAVKGDRLQPSLRLLDQRLQAMRDPQSGKPLFETDGDFRAAERNRSGRRERVKRLSHLRQLLDQDRPVVLHMGRPFPYAGHYLTLVGYTEEKGKRRYAYVDTSHPDKGISWVDERELIEKRWYRPEKGWIPAAVWNGRYLSFWPRDT